MSETNSTVEYRSIPGFPAYRVGNDGSVWSRFHGRGTGERDSVWKKLKPGTGVGRYGHLTVVLCPGRCTRFVHRLVLEAFVGPRPEGMECRHFPDRDPANNCLENLQWGTRQQNSADSITHGTTNRGQRNPCAKLTDEMIKAIRRRHVPCERGYQKPTVGSITWLAKTYGVTRAVIRKIVNGQAWKHVV